MELDSPLDITCQTNKKIYFDEVIGHIEDIFLSDDFVTLHNDFLERHYLYFEDIEENPLEYMDIYLEYVNYFEKYLSEKIHERMPNFDEQRFAAEFVNENKNGEIFELLNSFHSFQAFKELILDYRQSKDSENLDGVLVTKRLVNKDA